VIIAAFGILNSPIFYTLICSRKIWSRDLAKLGEGDGTWKERNEREREREKERERKREEGKEHAYARKKRVEGIRKGIRWGKESMFSKKKSSRERSRLGLPSWRNTRRSFIVFSALSLSLSLPSPSLSPSHSTPYPESTWHFTPSASQLSFPLLFFSYLGSVHVEAKVPLLWSVSSLFFPDISTYTINNL